MPRLAIVNQEVQAVLQERGTPEHPVSPKTRGEMAAAMLESAVRDACEMWDMPA
jgi:hypothetical protein